MHDLDFEITRSFYSPAASGSIPNAIIFSLVHYGCNGGIWDSYKASEAVLSYGRPTRRVKLLSNAIKHLKCNSCSSSGQKKSFTCSSVSALVYSLCIALLRALLKRQGFLPQEVCSYNRAYLNLNPSDDSSLDTKNTHLGASAA